MTEEEFREAVSPYWEIDEIRPAFLYGNAVPLPDTVGAAGLDRVVQG